MESETQILVESSRLDNTSIVISVLHEALLCQILGRRYSHIHGRCDQSRWKTILQDITRALRKSIDRNVDSDALHVAALESHLSELERASKSKSVADITVIFSLIGIVAELLGGVPDYDQRYRLNSPSDYIYNYFRNVKYSQQPIQKVRTILKASQQKPYKTYHKYEDLRSMYLIQYKGNAMSFVKWYKTQYPKAYSELF